MQVAPFAYQLASGTIPPGFKLIQEHLKKILPIDAQLLQWAIVKTDITSNAIQLYIEGSYCH